jgi:hypothetical protein
VTSPCTESLGRNHAEEWSTTGQEAPGIGQPGGAGRAWVGQARPNRPGVWRARPGPGVAEVVARVEVMREREREEREKERVDPSTIPAYIHRANTSANEHKQASLRGGRGTLCSSANQRT